MRGSGLSLERFIKGKAQRTKADAKSKKKVIIHKALRKREYEKIKKREGISTQRGRNPVTAAVDDNDASGPTSFYDRFFKDLQTGGGDADTASSNDEESDDDDHNTHSAPLTSNTSAKRTANDRRAPPPPRSTAKPDPFFKAKKKAAAAQLERERVREAKQQQRAVVEQKVSSRKKRHVKLAQRTATGQPVVKNHISDILARLQQEKTQ